MHSLNVGLREAHDLSERVAGILHGTGTPAELEAYEAERQAEWKVLAGIGGAPRASADTDPFVARNAARILGCTPASGAELRALLGQAGLTLP
jgi:hypothetical protein